MKILMHHLMFVPYLLCILQVGKIVMLHPIILVPGDWRNLVHAKLNKTNTPKSACGNITTDYFTIWINYTNLFPTKIECWKENMLLLYDAEEHKTRNNDGVEIEIPYFGDTKTVEWTYPFKVPFLDYFYTLAQMLVDLGYTRNVNIRSAPYDFRKAPNELQEYFKNVKSLIENTYKECGKKVIVIGHSMGATILISFLNSQTAQWKNNFILTFISVSAGWGGSMKALNVLVKGHNLGVPFLNDIQLRSVLRTHPSFAWMIPSKEYWTSNDIIITSKTKNYSVYDLDAFFQLIQCKNCYNLRSDTETYQYFDAPGVELHCIYSSGLKTIAGFKYTGDVKEDSTPEYIMGNGDSSVNLRSLEGCLRWKNSKYPLYTKEIPKVQHTSLLKHHTALNYIRNLIIQKNKEV